MCVCVGGGCTYITVERKGMVEVKVKGVETDVVAERNLKDRR
jgi:hypothetical protein